MKTVRFIIGPPSAGKTTERQNNPDLRELPFVDLYDIQYELYPETGGSNTDEVWRSYEASRERLLALLDENDDVVFEHTLLKKQRRPYYIDAIREKYPDAVLVCYYVYPEREEHAYRSEKRRLILDGRESEIENLRDKMSEGNGSYGQMEWDMFEVPEESDGFDKVVHIS